MHPIYSDNHSSENFSPAFVGATTHESDATLQHGRSCLETASKTESCLVQIYPPDVVGGMLLLGSAQFVIGRDNGSDLTLADKSVSRRHAVIAVCDDACTIRDLASTNGTWVNDKQVETATLQSGDIIQVGIFLLKYISGGNVEAHYHEAVYSALTRDALTGAMNKRYLLEWLQREMDRSAHQHRPLATLMLDIDHFKNVNDTYGHVVGDQVLREFADRIWSVCRKEDLLGRYGGEEFCLVLGCASLEDARLMGERCRAAVANTPFATTAGPLNITASFGAAAFDRTACKTAADLIHLADQQLYQAKRNGRNQVSG